MKIRSAIALTVTNLALAVAVHLAWPVVPSDAASKPVSPLAPMTEEDRLIKVIAKSSPAVVSIVIESAAPTITITQTNNGKVEQEQTQDGLQEVGRGTGFLVSADGMIVTNRHVASDRVSKYTALLSDGRSFAAKVLDIDPANDLAFLKIDQTGLPFLTVSPNDNLRIGQNVIAIGNALGKYDNTVTRGILSGVNRSVDATDGRTGKTESLEDILQTDAAINNGNSGGPLIDGNGMVIGVNTAVENDGRGLGFAIPGSEVRKDLASYARYGSIARPRLGVRYFMITPELQLRKHLDLKEGAYLGPSEDGQPAIVAGGPGFYAGLHSGDIITQVNGIKIAGKMTLSKIIQNKSVGDQVKLKVVRGSDTLDITASLDAYAPISP